jgi:hypothetical protein
MFRIFLLSLWLVGVAVAGKQARTSFLVTATVLPRPAKPVVTTEVINGVTVITLTY